MSTETTDTSPDQLPAFEQFDAEAGAGTVSGYFQAWWVRVQAGDLGSLPIIIGLIIIAIVFGTLEDTFFTARNFTNLLVQMSGVATIAIGVVFVLLIAEIDLSVAFNSAVGGVVLALLLRPDNPGWHWTISIIVALSITTFVGLVMALIITKAGVPSFVVSLAFLLGLSGVVLVLTTQASDAGTILIQDNNVRAIAREFLPTAWGWIFGIAVIAGFAGSQFLSYTTRRRRGLPTKPTPILAAQIALLALVVVIGVAVANTDRGVPFVIVILGAFLLFWSFIAGRTRFGRHVYAVGGNPEAARRAGINVDRVRTAVFMISGFMAGAGGIVIASRLQSVATNTGGGNLLLLAIASAVIGGTSLFGGQGKVVSALLGALVITSVQNGMDLLGLAAGYKFIITGLVLLAAVLVDSLSKQRQAASGVR